MVNWFVLAVIAAVSFGIMVVLIKITLTKGLNSVLLTTYLFTFTTIFLWIYVALTQKIIIPSTSISILILITALVAVIANLTLFKSYNLVSNPSYTHAVGSISVIVAFLLSIFIFNLRPDLISIIGIMLIIGGTVLLARVV